MFNRPPDEITLNSTVRLKRDQYDGVFIGSVDYHFNHLSNGTQVCAGKKLALFIAKAVLVNLLLESHLKLLAPATLQPQLPLPHTYNYYDIEIERTAPVHGAATA